MTIKSQPPENFRLRKLDVSSTPDWREWKLIPRDSVRCVCLLSLNLNPHRISEFAWPEEAGKDYYDEFYLRQRVLDSNLQSDPEKFSGSRYHKHVVRLAEFAAWALSIGWDIPAELAAMAKVPVTETAMPAATVEVGADETASEEKKTTEATNEDGNDDANFAALFDPVTVEALEKMFPASGKWVSWAERAARNGLEKCRNGRAKFDPYKAGQWFLDQGIAGWDIARVRRVLGNNLPDRSLDSKYLLTGELDH